MFVYKVAFKVVTRERSFMEHTVGYVQFERGTKF